MSKFTLKTEPIINFGNKDLRQICKKVNVFHKSLHNKIDIMANTLHKNGGGAALAAPQISLLKRIIVIDYLGEYYELINPVILSTFGSVVDYEGCLSLPNFIGKVKRYQKIKVSYQDRFGEQIEVEVENEIARCFQHEIDHLDGILYIDRMTDKYILNQETNEKMEVKRLLELIK